MDWFERLTGFRETAYRETRDRLTLDGEQLRSRAGGRSYGIGHFEMPSVQELRERARAGGALPGRLRVRLVTGDVRRLHASPDAAGALFQVASQFNMLEMISPDVTPEQGVTGYEFDQTQGPACAIAAGAATIYRNYFVPVDGQAGQTARRQLDGLVDIGAALAVALGQGVPALWSMRNGYALCTPAGLAAIGGHLGAQSPAERDRLRERLRIGVQWDVEVSDTGPDGAHRVSQVFCSALPVAYSSIAPAQWAPFATLILEGAYEATLLAAACNAQRGRSHTVYLTRLGGGAFGNDDAWIDAAMARALDIVRACDLDVRLVSFGAPPASALALARAFA